MSAGPICFYFPVVRSKASQVIARNDLVDIRVWLHTLGVMGRTFRHFTRRAWTKAAFRRVRLFVRSAFCSGAIGWPLPLLGRGCR